MNIYEFLNPEKEYLKGKKAFIFDMDGTLIDSMFYWYSATTGKTEDFPSYREYMTDKYNTVIEPKPFSVEFLSFLKEHNVPYCIATDTPRWMSRGFMKRFPEFASLAENYIDCEDAGSSKGESAKIYEIAADKLGFKKEECIVFEDYSVSIKSAHNGGFDVVAVYDYVCSQEENMDEVIKENAVDYIQNMSEMMR